MKSPKRVRVALLQARAGSDPAENLRRQERLFEEASEGGAAIICTQELFASPYFCQEEDVEAFRWAESIDGPTVRFLREQAQRAKAVVIGSFFERRAPGLFHNTAVVIDGAGELLGSYRKMHIPDDPGYYEKYYFTPGDLGFRVWPTAAGRLGVLICWDQWYPEAARLTALQGAEVLFYPSAIGWHPHEKESEGAAQADAWRTIQRSHAIANGCFVVAVNRVGREEGPGGRAIEFWGRSFVADPMGRVLAEASEKEEVLLADLDLGLIEQVRIHWPFFRDRRVDAYGEIAARYLG
ncbi:N-carbamoylputrescine amidase [Methylacidimicrobium cyclopophantes]|uniref:N-carbamoylputrescine amidase n=1 Tax=Methylacidimicrobium cyclopophantes TaxID=1041766 RepID=A0A5E6MFQ6_9BACT|nr:carbon-nitrogen hydrolase [Methylacidimicrobium cyclopophantes]VVM07841.1 N-carbamoylputrescine amidase [Methylacidimicrobium cyclopophantes]